MKVWIDLSNSPHPLLFWPVARRLTGDGHEVLITVRDHAQTAQLALERWPEAEVIGGGSPRARLVKGQRIAGRAMALRAWAAARRPDVALSHNSYAQIVAARSLRIRAVTAMDYEYQPANHLAFRLATTVVVPAVVPAQRIRRQGATEGKTVRYPGLKEELYLGDFDPDPGLLSRLGVEPRAPVVAVVRTPPRGALYHGSVSALFEQAFQVLRAQPQVACVILTRDQEEAGAIQALGLGNCVVPREPVDSRALLYVSDGLLGGGGTMTREAALMGIPTWSAFAGRAGAVDEWLGRRGKLRQLSSADELRDLGPRSSEPSTPDALRARSEKLQSILVEAALGAVQSDR